MFEESRENTGGVIAGMLRSLEDGHLDIVPSAELKRLCHNKWLIFDEK